MSNHLEDLTAEWLEYNGYFVRKSVLVGRLPKGGYEGELDVVAYHPARQRLIHVECSLDANPWGVRENRFASKFERGRRFIGDVFGSLSEHLVPDQVALLQLRGGDRNIVGTGRIVCVRDLISDIFDRLASLNPDRNAVPSTLPMLRSMQLAAQPHRKFRSGQPLIDDSQAGEPS